MFISFEGGEGTGKTTLIEIVKKSLEEKGFEVVLTREPGGKGSLISEAIRDLVLDPQYKNVNSYTEAYKVSFTSSTSLSYATSIATGMRNRVFVYDRLTIFSSKKYEFGIIIRSFARVRTTVARIFISST